MTQALGESKMDFGALKRLKILCISETGWHDTETLLADTKDAGGKGGESVRYPSACDGRSSFAKCRRLVRALV